jgi:chromosome segregation ATPase
LSGVRTLGPAPSEPRELRAHLEKLHGALRDARAELAALQLQQPEQEALAREVEGLGAEVARARGEHEVLLLSREKLRAKIRALLDAKQPKMETLEEALAPKMPSRFDVVMVAIGVLVFALFLLFRR